MDKTPSTDAPELHHPTMSDDDNVLRYWYSPSRESSDEFLLPGEANKVSQPAIDTQAGYFPNDNATAVELSYAGDRGIAFQPMADQAFTLPYNMVWEAMVGPDCSGQCNVLREVIHGNDSSRFKLSLHGPWGLINHAVLYVNLAQNPDSQNRFIVDLRSFDFKTIKLFLENYGRGRYRDGQKLLLDTVPPIYRALAVPLNPGRGLHERQAGVPPCHGASTSSGRMAEVGESSSSPATHEPESMDRVVYPNPESQ